MHKTKKITHRPQHRRLTKGKIRLQKLIAQTTSLSRRAAERVILEGKIKVNGQIVTKLGSQVDPSFDQVILAGRILTLSPKLIYLVYYKPRGELVTKTDPQNRPTIWDKLGEWKDMLNAAGRLDMSSEGLLLLTNDGDLLNRLIHPRYELLKLYEVKVKGLPSPDALLKLQKGLVLEDGPTKKAQVRLLKKEACTSWLEIGISEGRKRQVRRMCEAVGHSVLRLRRVAVGPIKLGKMRARELRPLTDKELNKLKRALQGN